MDVLKKQTLKDISNHANKLFYIKPSKLVLGKSEVCNMKLTSGAFDKSEVDGNTIFLISEENGEQRYVYIG